METSKTLITGSDIWLNCPKSPLEASGTSIIKALINGCLVLSSPDGWVLEAKGGVTYFGKERDTVDEHDYFYEEAYDMYDRLEELLDLYHNDHINFYLKKKFSSLNNYRFASTDRVVEEYFDKMWTTGL